MKRLYIFILLAVSIAFLITCKKKPELKIYNLELTEETVNVTTNCVTVMAKYSYPGDIPSVQFMISTMNDMTGSIDCNAVLDSNTLSATVNNLAADTKYYYRFRYSNGIALIDTDIRSFTTEGFTLPEVTTGEITDITSTSIHCAGEVTSAGNGNIIARGFCWSTNDNPTIINNNISCGNSLGYFEATISNLTIHTLYYIRAYTTNEKGTAYGETKQCTTLGQVPVLTTIPVASVTDNSAVSGGNITDDGGYSVTAERCVLEHRTKSNYR